MGKTGILLETDNGEVKAANYGVITAARETGDNEVVGFIMDGAAEACKAAVQEYGLSSVIEIKAGDGDFKESPELQANALAEAYLDFKAEERMDTSQATVLPRVAATMQRQISPRTNCAMCI